jgi:acetyltransferase
VSANISARSSFKSPQSVISPQSIAIVGASERAAWPSAIFRQLKASGFSGPIYPVNPRGGEVWGERAYPDLASLPSQVEHALVVVPAPAVLGVLETGVANGLKSATIYSGNIGEGSDPEGVARGMRLRELVAQTGLVVNGPNCMGGNSFHHNFFGYPNGELLQLDKGSVAFISQSGGMVQFFAKSAGERGVKFSTLFSTGNEIDLDLADYVNFLVDDEHTHIITLFIEGIRRTPIFLQAAARALAAGKPILAIKTGKSQKSREAAKSHTGAISGDYDGFRAMCDRYGIVACETLEDLMETALAFQAGRLPQGPRIGWVTTSGGTVDLLYDAIEEIGGTRAPEFSPQTVETLRAFVPAEIGVKNPLDAGIPTTDQNAIDMCAAVANDPRIDMIAWAAVLPNGKRRPDPAILRTILERTQKPFLAFGRMAYQLGPDALDFQNQVGFPYLQGLPQTINALAALAFYAERQGRKIEPLPPSNAALTAECLSQALSERGIPAPVSRFASTPTDVADAAREIGFPVVLKIVSPDILHKTEVGGVHTGLSSASDVEHAAHQMLMVVRKRASQATITGFMVQEQAMGVELLIGLRRDPLYGPMLTLGAGGIFVELMKDVAHCLLPVEASDVEQLLAKLRIARLLDGWRGSADSDKAALIRAIVSLCQLYLDHRDAIGDIEINPLIVMPEGRGLRAVDIRITPSEA